MARERTPAQSPSPVPSAAQRMASNAQSSSRPNSRRGSTVASTIPNQTAHRSNSPSWAALAAGAVQKSEEGTVKPQDLIDLTGANLRLTLMGSPERVYEGSLWCCDPKIGLLALECLSTNPTAVQSSRKPPLGNLADYRLIKISSLKSFEVISPSTGSTPLPEMKAISIPAVQAVEAAAVKAVEARSFRLAPKGAGRLGQEIFDALGKTLPVRWAQATIVVMDEVIIHPPYDVKDCQTPQSEGAGRTRLDRVRKVLEGERTRLLRLFPELESQAKS